jgi:hypothetical protein
MNRIVKGILSSGTIFYKSDVAKKNCSASKKNYFLGEEGALKA